MPLSTILYQSMSTDYNTDMIKRTEIGTEPERVHRIFELLEQRYPQTRSLLIHQNPFQLFVAVLLSAQTTDEQVNRITARLFATISTPQQMARLQPEELEPYLKECGLYRNKSRYLVEACRMIVKDFGGEVPDNFDSLILLPGIGRKCANVILNVAFGKPALAVDTHVFRVARRLGLASGSKPEVVEEQLKKLLPPETWGSSHRRLIAYGRDVCRARRPRCDECMLNHLCRWVQRTPGKESAAVAYRVSGK